MNSAKISGNRNDQVYPEGESGARSGVALEMKTNCEKCGSAAAMDAEAFVCSCAGCTAEMKNICPNCGGELVRRPRRKVTHEPA